MKEVDGPKFQLCRHTMETLLEFLASKMGNRCIKQNEQHQYMILPMECACITVGII